MKGALYILLGWALLVVQSTAVSYGAAGLPQPDLLLIVMIYLGFTTRPQVGLPLALTYGYLLDLFIGGIAGAYLLQYASLYFLCWALRGRLRMSSRLAQAAVVFSFTALGALELKIVARAMGVPETAVGAVGLGLLLRGVFNAALGLLIFPALVRLDRRLWPRAGRLSMDLG